MENPYELNLNINIKLDKTITEEHYLKKHPYIRKKVNNINKKHKEELSKEQVSKKIKFEQNITIILYHTDYDLFTDSVEKKSYTEFTSQKELEWLNKIEESRNKSIKLAKILSDNLETEDETSFLQNDFVVCRAESYKTNQIKKEESKNKIRPNLLECQSYYDITAILDESHIISVIKNISS